MKKKGLKKNPFGYLLDLSSNAVVNLVKWLNKVLNDKKKSALTKTIIRIACCLILLALLEIPFLIVGKVGEGILYLCNFTFNNELLHGWNFLIKYAYLIFALILLLNTVVDMSKKKEYNFELNNSLQSGKNLYYAVTLVLKIVITVVLIPLMLLAIVLFAVLGMTISLITHGIYVLGPILIIAGLLIMICFTLSYLYDVINPKKGGNK